MSDQGYAYSRSFIWKIGLLIFSCAIAAASQVASEPGFAYWSATQLKSYARSLAPKMNEKKRAASQPIHAVRRLEPWASNDCSALSCSP